MPRKSRAGGAENYIGGLFEDLRAQPGLRGSGRAANDDAQVGSRIVRRVEASDARVEQRIDETQACGAISSVEHRHDPASNGHQNRRLWRWSARVTNDVQRALQPRSTSRPSASQ